MSADEMLFKTKLAEIASQMGAVYQLDLTNDVTHLLVGSINTPKYKYVAKERPDVRVLLPDFINAVRDAWMTGGEVNVGSLEKQYTLPTFFGLQLCLTGVEDMDKRKEMESTIIAHGGLYNGDLTKQITHLIVAKPAGAKYMYAKQWGIHVVSLKWYTDCLLRAMSVDENYYLPEMPLEEQGVGAFRTAPEKTSLGKRGRDDELGAKSDEPGRKKLRKSFSRKMNRQSQEFWQSQSGHEIQVDHTTVDAWEDESRTMSKSEPYLPMQNPDHAPSLNARPSEQLNELLSGYAILIHGFNERRTETLRRFLEPNGASVAASLNELEHASQGDTYHSTCILVPHDNDAALPTLSSSTAVVTEWWLERCIHFKKLLRPEEDPLSSPLCSTAVSGFSGINIAMTGFDSVDLRQSAIAVKLMGAKYLEEITPSLSLIVCASQTMKKEKAYYARKHKIPVVSLGWLQQSLKTRTMALVEDYLLKLPLVALDDMTGSPSGSSSAPSHHVPPFRRSGEPQNRFDDLNPKRLSNTRRRQATSTLSLQATRSPTKELSKPSRCPFVLEDDEGHEAGNVLAAPSAATPDAQNLATPPGAPFGSQQRLRNLSPNVSQGTEKENHQDEESKKKDLTMELASLLRRHANSDKAAISLEEKKRKHRPLGRNLSVISNKSNSASGSPAILAEIPQHLSPADGFAPSREPVLPPSTQLGYENPEAEAHRLEMSRKMGLKLEETGTRDASIGTVRDTREVASRSAAVASRSKTRNRPRT